MTGRLHASPLFTVQILQSFCCRDSLKHNRKCAFCRTLFLARWSWRTDGQQLLLPSWPPGPWVAGLAGGGLHLASSIEWLMTEYKGASCHLWGPPWGGEWSLRGTAASACPGRRREDEPPPSMALEGPRPHRPPGPPPRPLGFTSGGSSGLRGRVEVSSASG